MQRKDSCDNFDKTAIDLLEAVKILTDLQKEQGEQYASLLNKTISKAQEQYDVSQNILIVLNEQFKVSWDNYKTIEKELINIRNDTKQAMAESSDGINECVKTATENHTAQMQQYFEKAFMENTKRILNEVSDILTSIMTNQREDLQTYFKNSVSENKEPLFDEVSAMLACVINTEIEELQKYLENYLNDISNDLGNIKTYSGKANHSFRG